MIKVNKLSKSFGNKKVLNSINCSFEQGKIYGIIGENGAGKTTFFDCIAQIQSYEGNITSIYEPRKNQIAYLQAESYFFPKTTGREYIQFICSARKLGKIDADAYNRFQLPLDNYVETYSTGMKKKLAITALLSIPNTIYILDEPFNGVDLSSNITIIECIKFLKQHNKTVIIASHIFETLQATCDSIFWLKEGTLSHAYLPNDYGKLYQAFLEKQKIENAQYKISL